MSARRALVFLCMPSHFTAGSGCCRSCSHTHTYIRTQDRRACTAVWPPCLLDSVTFTGPQRYADDDSGHHKNPASTSRAEGDYPQPVLCPRLFRCFVQILRPSQAQSTLKLTKLAMANCSKLTWRRMPPPPLLLWRPKRPASPG